LISPISSASLDWNSCSFISASPSRAVFRRGKTTFARRPSAARELSQLQWQTLFHVHVRCSILPFRGRSVPYLPDDALAHHAVTVSLDSANHDRRVAHGVGDRKSTRL